MCPDENALVAMIEHALEPGRIMELERHFDTCVHCCEMIAALAGTRSIALGTPRSWARHALGLDVEDAAPIAKGTVVGRYEVGSLIGRGGMGTVYLARDTSLDRDVALKLHRVGSGDDRLQREALAMAKLAHPNVVAVFETGTIDDRLFVAMEYVRGGTLRTWLASAPRTWRGILDLLVEVGGGLAAAHAAGLIHRDFKPENVLVGTDGRPRVGDFGLARLDPAELATPADPATRSGSSTLTGTVLGTPAYMAPEQFVGGAIDGRCDQFAFCVVLWECLFGRRPFAGNTIAAIQLAIENAEREAPARRDIPERVRHVIERGLAADPADRYPDMPALLAALRHAAVPQARRRIVIAAAASLVVAGAAIPIGFAVRSHQHEAACDAEAESVRVVYGDDQRASLERELVATGSPFAKTAFERTSSVLERYSDALAKEAGATCRGRDEPAAVTAARRACLAERTSELAGLVAALSRRDKKLVLRAPGAAWAIYEPAPCHEPAVTVARPKSPDQVAMLGRVTGLHDTGQYAEAIALATPLVEDARRRGDRNAELAALLALGRARAEIDMPAESTPVLHKALALAEALGRDLDASGALDLLANIAGLTQHDYGAAHRYLDLSRAKLERLGDGNLVARGRLFAIEAQVLMDEFRIVEAEPVIRRAVATLEQAYGPDHPQLGNAMGIMSQVLRGVGKDDESLVASRRTLQILERALGEHHPTVAGAQMNLASALISVKQFAEARERLRTADAVFARVFGDDHPVRAAVAGNLGSLEQLEQNWDAAIAAYRNALAVLERTEGPKSASASGARRDIALTYAASGRLDQAIPEMRRAIEILEGLGDDGLSRMRGALTELAQFELERKGDALAIAERAMDLATRRPEGTTPDEMADTQFTLARALWEANRERDRARAHELAKQAAAGVQDPKQRAEITEWLEQRVSVARRDR
jgi:predicted Ser/Thr protein kinase